MRSDNLTTSLNWKLLSSRYVHKGMWATLRVDRCEMPNGHMVEDYYVLEYADWVNAVALTEDNKVILVKQYRHAVADVSLELPGGVMDEGETPEQAVRRELLEETGYEFTSAELLCNLWPNPSTGNNSVRCYLLRGGKKVSGQHLDAQEEIEIELYTAEEVRQLLADNAIKQAMHVAGLFYALPKLKDE
ncbi:NUDIX hydrolase [Mucilaginibacter sp.]